MVLQMQQNNLQLERKSGAGSRPLQVALLGIEAADKEKFIRFFQITRLDQPRYTVVNTSDKAFSDILMVNYDDPAALKEKEVILGAHPQIQVVAVSRGPLDEPPVHHIRGMLFAARVLTTLDKASVMLGLEAVSVQPQQGVQPVAETPLLQHQAPLGNGPATAAIVTTSETIPVASQSQPAAIQLQEGVGTLPLPLEAEPAPQVQPETSILTHAPAVTAKVVEGQGYRVLVVDDSLAIQKSLELNLVTLPQISLIDFADSGESALEKAEAMQYDLIFLDVMMPGIDGYETCTRLRKKPEYKKTPIIMVSGKTSPLDEVKGVMSGCTTYLTKPVQHEAFQKLSIRVLSWLERQKKP